MDKSELKNRIDSLKSDLEQLDAEQHIESVREAMAEAARSGADDETLREHAAMLRHAVAGSDDHGARRTITLARLHAAEAELQKLEEAEQIRQRERLAAEAKEAGQRLTEAAQQAAVAFREAVRAHLRVTTILEHRERAKAALQGRVFDGVARGDLFRFPQIANLYGDVVPASAFALGRDDAELRQMIAEVTAEVATELSNVVPIKVAA